MLKQPIILLIKIYRYALSPMLGQHCRFYPSCSSYALLAIEQHGVMRGLWLSTRRILRCHPFHEGGYDPVPGMDNEHAHNHGHDESHQCGIK